MYRLCSTFFFFVGKHVYVCLCLKFMQMASFFFFAFVWLCCGHPWVFLWGGGDLRCHRGGAKNKNKNKNKAAALAQKGKEQE